MNVREGVRRLALFTGALGAVLGVYASYLVSHDILEARARYREFNLLANSDVVQFEQISWNLTLSYKSHEAIDRFRKLPANQQREIFHSLSGQQQDDLLAKLDCGPLSPSSPSTAAIEKNLLNLPEGATLALKDDPYACTAQPIDPPTSTLNKDGIKTIRWTKDLGVESIELEDGRTVYPELAPSRWLYFLAATLPLLGFFLPWSLVRAIGWVGAGFSTTPK
jgi:hypothetical protein